MEVRSACNAIPEDLNRTCKLESIDSALQHLSVSEFLRNTLCVHSGVCLSRLSRHATCAMLQHDITAHSGIAAAVLPFAAAFFSLLLVDYTLSAVCRRRPFRRDEMGTPQGSRAFTHKIFASPTATARAPQSRVVLKGHVAATMALMHAILHPRSVRFLLGFLILPLVWGACLGQLDNNFALKCVLCGSLGYLAHVLYFSVHSFLSFRASEHVKLCRLKGCTLEVCTEVVDGVAKHPPFCCRSHAQEHDRRRRQSRTARVGVSTLSGTLRVCIDISFSKLRRCGCCFAAS